MSTTESAWTPEAELALFKSMVGLRPVGIHKHFRLVNIYTRFLNQIGGTDISINDVKGRLNSLFNMELLEEIEEEDEDEDEDEDNHAGEKDGISSDGTSAVGESKRASSLGTANSSKNVLKSGRKSSGKHTHPSENDGSGSDGEGSNTGTDEQANSNVSKASGSSVPVAGIVSEIDMSDPQFWRKTDSEFALPWSDFGSLMIERAGVGVSEDHEDIDRTAESVASTASTPKTTTSAPESEPRSDAEADEEQDADHEVEMEPEHSDGRVSPVQRKRKTRPSTPVSRGRAKTSTRSSTASARKRQKTR